MNLPKFYAAQIKREIGPAFVEIVMQYLFEHGYDTFCHSACEWCKT